MAVTLFETALHGTMGELRHLVEYGCQNFRERDPSGNTVLHYALRATSASGSAGMTCYYDEHSYLKFGVQTTETGLSVLLEKYAGQEVLSRRTFRPVHGGPAGLRVTAAKGKRSFSVCGPEGQWQTLAEIPEPAYLTSEGLSVGKRFTGAMVGLYVHGNFAVRFLDWTVHWRRPETCTGEE